MCETLETIYTSPWLAPKMRRAMGAAGFPEGLRAVIVEMDLPEFAAGLLYCLRISSSPEMGELIRLYDGETEFSL